MQENEQDKSIFNRQNDLGCICNLCNCGGHRCCSIVNGSDGIMDKPDNNRCTMEKSRRDRCQCISSLGEQRYLTTSVTPTNNRCNNQSQENEEELLHVLVTRPEIVGKPRDNIVFEGDMDLKTTFETSYEALAKMRLECWKRHQELIRQGKGLCCKQVAAGVSGKTCHQSSVDSASEEEVDSNNRMEVSNTDDQQQQQQVVSVAVDAEQLAELRSGVNLNMEDQSRSIRELASPNCESDELACCQTTINERVDAAVQVDLAEPSSSVAPRASPLQSYENCCHNNNNNRTQIDPDLTPIIVYDANMNRLERVGLRKRSKYRPSTSLRSGVRGLFGDQEPPMATGGREREKQHAASGSCQKAHAINGAEQVSNFNSHAEDELRKQNSQTNMAQNYQNNTSRAWDSEPTVKTELALNARNLKDSRQKDYLMYTDGNLPVDRKRRLCNNVNMVDHIKEQNIAESSYSNSSRPATVNEPQKAFITSGHDFNQNRVQVLQDDELKLAKQEEEDAVEELRKITENSIEQASASAASGQDMTDRKSRLKRTCQNQNFDIHDNEYQETGSDMTTRVEERGTRLTPQSRVYTNLFRESPDFIQTTGKYLENEEVQRSKTNGGSKISTDF